MRPLRDATNQTTGDLGPPAARHRRRGRRGAARGFTLVETLVAVLIIAVLAALVVPRFTDAAGESRAGNTLTQLHTLRTALHRYKMDHQGNYPPTDALWPSLTQHTDRAGAVRPDGSLGPYLSGTPVNIYTNASKVTGNMTSMDTAFGWCYDPTEPDLIQAVGFDEATQTFSTTPK